MKKKLLAILLAAMLVAVMLPTAFAADPTSITINTPVIYKTGAAANTATGINSTSSGPVFVVPFTINNPAMDGSAVKDLTNQNAYLESDMYDDDIKFGLKADKKGGFAWFEYDSFDDFYLDEDLIIEIGITYGTGWFTSSATYTVGNDFWKDYMGNTRIINSVKIDEVKIYGSSETSWGTSTAYLKYTTDPASFLTSGDCYDFVGTIQLVRNDKDVSGATTDFDVKASGSLYGIDWGWDINIWDLREARVGDKLKVTLKATDENGFTATSDAYMITIDEALMEKLEVAFPDVKFGSVTVLNETEAKEAGMLKAYETIEGGMLYIPFEYIPFTYGNWGSPADYFDLTIATKDYSSVNQTGWKLSGTQLEDLEMKYKQDSVTGLYTYNQAVGLSYGEYFKDKDNSKSTSEITWQGKPFSAKAGDVWVITVSFEQLGMDFSYSYELTLTQAMINVLTTGEGSVLLGDVNGDGVVNTKDASLILQDIVKLRTLTTEEKARALLLVSGSTEVSTKHASNILKLIVGLPIS